MRKWDLYWRDRHKLFICKGLERDAGARNAICKHKREEVAGIEPASERGPVRVFARRNSITPPKGRRGVRIELLSTTEGHPSYLFP